MSNQTLSLLEMNTSYLSINQESSYILLLSA